MSLTLTSPAFSSNGLIPSKYTCDGEDSRSPALSWQDDLSGVKSYVLIMDDPDAPRGTWDHWILFNIPENIKQIPEAGSLPPGVIQGNNSWGSKGYRGPCPPSGTHRYFFKLYALDSQLNLPEGTDKENVLKAMEGHVIGSTELIGRYQKAK